MTTQDQSKEIEQIFFTGGHQVGAQHPIDNNLNNLLQRTRELYNNIDLLVDSFIQRCHTEGIPVDCHIGCSWCCNQVVFASTHEIIVVTNYLKKHFSTKVVDRVIERAEEKEKKLKPLTPIQTIKSRHACPLLVKGRCIIYPVRPMACRIYLSSNEKSCLARHQNPYDPKSKPALFDFTLKAGKNLNEGFASALKEQGLSVEEHRIEHILLLLLRNPGKINEWLKGATLHRGFPFDETIQHQPGKE